MNLVTVRLNEEEEKLYNEYAKLHGIPLSTLFKQTLESKMEDELDMKAIQEYEENMTEETQTHEEMKKTLGF
ncbi:type II toxin-antitoxin system RelB family antitoxin [Aliicoccus persicus]|uniref:Toxin-antitoxin system, antitoxin component, ribbon-helix-helix domain protein n=1 Tax=Aliicoccus persicus TaxID=930138 RepID=A0A662Z0P4_9STAP|nr:DUF6290 family protein [Aliicoccus persicus]SEV82885.1 hypothetical protein SAMN05192557_0292 [Aliicoccus persicus]